MPVEREYREDSADLSPASVLVNPAKEPQLFSDFLSKWIRVQRDRKDARDRFFHILYYEHDYTRARLIHSANMFDVLRGEAAPPAIELDEQLQEARGKCREILKALPKSEQRDSVLNALGRLGHRTLKDKVRYRNSILKNAIPVVFDEIDAVTDVAVDYRNHYVHGTEPKKDFSPDMIMFLIDTLEFVFLATDLIECGWDAHEWSKGPRGPGNMTYEYYISYKQRLARFLSQAN
jgi:hypothetical protein